MRERNRETFQYPIIWLAPWLCSQDVYTVDACNENICNILPWVFTLKTLKKVKICCSLFYFLNGNCGKQYLKKPKKKTGLNLLQKNPKNFKSTFLFPFLSIVVGFFFFFYASFIFSWHNHRHFTFMSFSSTPHLCFFSLLWAFCLFAF